MSEILSFYADDAIKYGEEKAIILYPIRYHFKMPNNHEIEMDGIKFSEFNRKFFDWYLSYKPWEEIYAILTDLEILQVIKIIKRTGFYGNEIIYIGLI